MSQAMSQDVPNAIGGFTVSAVARRLGIAAATLRTWDRRYGLSPSLRTDGKHRRYTPSDIALLELMRQHIANGMSAADAARVAQHADPSSLLDPPPVSTGGGNVIAMPKGTTAQRGLARAANALDSESASTIISQYLASHGVVWTWDEVVAPVLRAIGQKYGQSAGADQTAGIDVEHHLSHIVIGEFIRHAKVSNPVNPRPVLLAAGPEELHTLPLYAVAAGLAERQISSRLLGARTPDAAMAAAIRRLGPVAVFIWAQADAGTDCSVAIPTIRPRPRVLVGGPGWHGVALPATCERTSDLTNTLSQIVQAVRPAAG